MPDKSSSKNTLSQEKETRRFFAYAGTAYGLVYGISFALIIWGRDALLLASSHAEFAWAKLLIGLPVAAIICGLAGRLAGSSSSAGVSVALGTVVGVVLGILVGHMPFEGVTLATWLMDRRLWGMVVFPFGASASARTALIIVMGALTGAANGFLEYMILDRAWDHATPAGKLSLRSWGLLLACILPTLVFMLGPVEEMINQPTRTPQYRTDQLIEIALSGTPEEAEARGLSYSSVAPFVESFSDQYIVHLVQYDPDSLYSAHVDVAFDNGFVIRCTTIGKSISFCDDLGKKLDTWIGDLAYFGIYGVQRWLEARIPYLAVDDSALSWLDARSEQLGESYELVEIDRSAGLIFVTARFDTGFEMTCRFRGMYPVRVDQCVEVGP